MTRTPSLVALALLVGGLLALAPRSAAAQQLTFDFRSSSFGGAPANFQTLLSAATAQNDFEEAREERDPLADFEANLQRQILNQLSRELISSRFEEIDFSEEGVFNFGDFNVEVIPGAEDVTIRVFNLLTGDESTISIPSLP